MKMLVKHLVVDSGGFINNAPIREISEIVYTLPAVVSEIKDKATKERLQVLPYELHLCEPSCEDIKFVTDFSKKTGDYPSLSATDLKVLALAVSLHSQHGKSALRTWPSSSIPWKVEGKSAGDLQQVVGFYNPLKTPHNDKTEENDQEPNEEDEEKESDDDESSWIGPETLNSALEQMGSLKIEDEREAVVGCVTTDFAMQNVLIQLGLPVFSTNGYLIREAKTFVLRCHACFHVTSIMTKTFCPRCGNQTLKRVAVTVDKDGQRKLHINYRRPINIRGTNQSLPLPKGGKHANNPILTEDQPVPQNRPKKTSLAKVNPLDPDYEARNSPFAMHDVHSRSAQLRTHVKRKSKR